MKKLTHRHISAVDHAKLFLNKAFATNPEPRFKREIEADMELLEEVKASIRDGLLSPALLFKDSKLDSDIKELHEDHSHGSKNAR